MSTAVRISRRVHSRLPRALQTADNLERLLLPLGDELARMDAAVSRLMRSRWHRLARGWAEGQALTDDGTPVEKRTAELSRIGTLYGLQPGRHETIEGFRRRLAAFVGIHRHGLGTAPAMLHLAALVYRAEAPPDVTWEDGVAVGTMRVRDAAGKVHVVRLHVTDTPARRAEAEFESVRPGDELAIANTGLDDAFPEIAITAGNGEVAVPALGHRESGVRVLFVGRIPAGATLTLRHLRPALVNDIPADRHFFPGDVYSFDGPDARFHSSSHDPGARFVHLDANAVRPVFVADAFRFDDADARFFVAEESPVRFARFEPDTALPPLRPGENHWSYRTLSREELDVFLPDDIANRHVLLSYAADGSAPPARLSFRWSEVVPATFTLRVPGDFLPAHARTLADLGDELISVLAYARAAGVRARLRIVHPVRQETISNVDTLTTSASVSHTERHALGAASSALTTTLDFSETVRQRDRFGTGGVFDNAYLDGATYVEPPHEDEPPEEE